MKNFLLFLYFLKSIALPAQNEEHQTPTILYKSVEPQPLLSQALRLNEALSFSGNVLSEVDIKLFESFK